MNGVEDSPSEEKEEDADGDEAAGGKSKKVELGWDKVDVVGACLKMGISR